MLHKKLYTSCDIVCKFHMMSKRATEKNNEDNDPCHRHVLNMMLLSCFMGAQEEGYFIKQKLHHSHTGGT
jgi:hypothetical protein